MNAHAPITASTDDAMCRVDEAVEALAKALADLQTAGASDASERLFVPRLRDQHERTKRLFWTTSEAIVSRVEQRMRDRL